VHHVRVPRRSVAFSMLFLAGQVILVAGCGGGRTGSSGAMSASSADCSGDSSSLGMESSFEVEPSSRLPSGRTPRAALDVFLAHGSVAGAAFFKSPRSLGFPPSGWSASTAKPGSVRFVAGQDSLTAVRVSGGQWQVLRGNSCTAAPARP